MSATKYDCTRNNFGIINRSREPDRIFTTEVAVEKNNRSLPGVTSIFTSQEYTTTRNTRRERGHRHVGALTVAWYFDTKGHHLNVQNHLNFGNVTSISQPISQRRLRTYFLRIN